MAENNPRNIWDVLGGVEAGGKPVLPEANETTAIAASSSPKIVRGRKVGKVRPGALTDKTEKRPGSLTLENGNSNNTAEEETAFESVTLRDGKRRTRKPRLSRSTGMAPQNRSLEQGDPEQPSREDVGSDDIDKLPIPPSLDAMRDRLMHQFSATVMVTQEPKSGDYTGSPACEQPKSPAVQGVTALPFKMDILQRARGLFKNINLDLHGRRSAAAKSESSGVQQKDSVSKLDTSKTDISIKVRATDVQVDFKPNQTKTSTTGEDIASVEVVDRNTLAQSYEPGEKSVESMGNHNSNSVARTNIKVASVDSFMDTKNAGKCVSLYQHQELDLTKTQGAQVLEGPVTSTQAKSAHDPIGSTYTNLKADERGNMNRGGKFDLSKSEVGHSYLENSSKKKFQATGCVRPMQKQIHGDVEEGPLDLSAPASKPGGKTNGKLVVDDHNLAPCTVDGPLDLTLKKREKTIESEPVSNVSRSRSITTIFRNGSTYSVLSEDEGPRSEMMYNNKGQPVSPVRPLLRVPPVVLVDKVVNDRSPAHFPGYSLPHEDAARFAFSTRPIDPSEGSSSVVTIHNMSNLHSDGDKLVDPCKQQEEQSYKPTLTHFTEGRAGYFPKQRYSDKAVQEPSDLISSSSSSFSPGTAQTSVDSTSPPHLCLVSPVAGTRNTRDTSPNMPLLSPLGSCTLKQHPSDLCTRTDTPGQPQEGSLLCQSPRQDASHEVLVKNRHLLAQLRKPVALSLASAYLSQSLTSPVHRPGTKPATRSPNIASSEHQNTIIDLTNENTMMNRVSEQSSQAELAFHRILENKSLHVEPNVPKHYPVTVAVQVNKADSQSRSEASKPFDLSVFQPTKRESKKALEKGQCFFPKAAFAFKFKRRKRCISQTRYYKAHCACIVPPTLVAGVKHGKSKVEIMRERYAAARPCRRLGPSTAAMATAVGKHKFIDWTEEFFYYKKHLCKTPGKLVRLPQKIPAKFEVTGDWQQVLHKEIEHMKDSLISFQIRRGSLLNQPKNVGSPENRNSNNRNKGEELPFKQGFHTSLPYNKMRGKSVLSKSNERSVRDTNSSLRSGESGTYHPLFIQQVCHLGEVSPLTAAENKQPPCSVLIEAEHKSEGKHKKSVKSQDLMQENVETKRMVFDETELAIREVGLKQVATKVTPPNLSPVDTVSAIIEAVASNRLPLEKTPKPPKQRQTLGLHPSTSNSRPTEALEKTKTKKTKAYAHRKLQAKTELQSAFKTKTEKLSPRKGKAKNVSLTPKVRSASSRPAAGSMVPQHQRVRASSKSSSSKRKTFLQHTQMKKRKASKLLKELSDTEGYIAMERFRQSGNLYSDPSQLSREERALQKALMRFSEMEVRKQDRKETLGKVSNLTYKAKQLKKKAVSGSPKRKALKRKDGRKVGYLDLPPQIFHSRTRLQALGGLKPGHYHKDRAYEFELEKEEQRRNVQRKKLSTSVHSELSQESANCSVVLSSAEVSTWVSKKRQKLHWKWKLKSKKDRHQAVSNTRKRKYKKPLGTAVLTASNPEALDITHAADGSVLPKPVIEWTRDDPADEPLMPISVEVEYDDTTSVSSAPTSDVQRLPPEVKMLKVVRDTGETALHKAARMGYVDAALWCCQNKYIDVNARDNAGFSPLHESCATGQLTIAKLLLAYGADVNLASRLDGVRPLHDAVQSDHIEMVRLLLSCGADPHISTFSGSTLFTMARSREMKEFLQDYLCDLNGPTLTQTIKHWEQATDDDEREDSGFDALGSIPPDTTDHSADVLFEFSDTEHVPTYRLYLSENEESRNYVLLWDLQEHLGLTRELLLETYPNLQVCYLRWTDFISQISHLQPQPPCKWLSLQEDMLQDTTQVVFYDDTVRRLLGLTVDTVEGEQVLFEEGSGMENDYPHFTCEEDDLPWQYDYNQNDTDFCEEQVDLPDRHLIDCPVELSSGGLVSLSYVEFEPGNVPGFSVKADHSNTRTFADQNTDNHCLVSHTSTNDALRAKPPVVVPSVFSHSDENKIEEESQGCSLKIANVCSLAAVDAKQKFGSYIVLTTPPRSPSNSLDNMDPELN